MAKKTNRVLLGLVCENCKRTNYVTQKNKINTSDKLEVQKFCKACGDRTNHKEKPRLK